MLIFMARLSTQICNKQRMFFQTDNGLNGTELPLAHNLLVFRQGCAISSVMLSSVMALYLGYMKANHGCDFVCVCRAVFYLSTQIAAV